MGFIELTVRQWRLAREISQETMAELLGVHVNTYISWEKKPEKIGIAFANKISEILEVPIENISFSSSTLQNVES